MSLILITFHTVKGRYLIAFVASSYLRAVSMDPVFFYTSSKAKTLLEVVQKNTAGNIKHFYTFVFVCCLQRQGICTLLHENLLSINKVLNNFLIHSI